MKTNAHKQIKPIRHIHWNREETSAMITAAGCGGQDRYDLEIKVLRPMSKSFKRDGFSGDSELDESVLRLIIHCPDDGASERRSARLAQCDHLCDGRHSLLCASGTYCTGGHRAARRERRVCRLRHAQHRRVHGRVGRAYTGAPDSAPSRFLILTGHYAARSLWVERTLAN